MSLALTFGIIHVIPLAATPRAATLIGRARLARQSGNFAEAERAYRLAVDDLGATDSTDLLGSTLNNLGTLKLEQGELNSARCLFEQGVAIHEGYGNGRM